jgi:glycosyltransferase involved in cell wall biosynthesis
MRSKKIVICDVNIQANGHYIGYNQFIIDNYHRVVENAASHELIFLYNREAKEYLYFPDGCKVMFLDFPKEQLDSLLGRIRIWKLVLEAANELNPDMLYFLDLDKFQIPVSLFRSKCDISTIYFRPHHRTFPSNKKLKTIVNTKIKLFKKMFSEVIVIAFNKKVKNIFILNDPSGVAYLNKFYNTNRFKHLPDPVFSYDSTDQPVNVENNGSAITFLAFGALAERKNIDNVIRAYTMAKFDSPTILKIIGSSKQDYFNKLQKLVAEVRSDLSETKRIILENKFVSNFEMDALHASSQVSLLLYKDFFGSSGLLGRASKHNMYVLASSVGLISELVNKYELGKTTDPGSIELMAAAMQDAAREYPFFKADGCKRFYLDHQPDQFLKHLMVH